MSYDYIRQYYRIDIHVGEVVQHTVTGRFGRIMPEGKSHLNYVRVLFQGDKSSSFSHPEELDYTAADKAGVQ